MTEDPVRDGLNWYGYCGGNPVAFVDPSGLKIGIPGLKKGTKNKKDKRFENLQELTDDKLTLDYSTGLVSYTPNSTVKRSVGTNLVRELIDNEILTEITLISKYDEYKSNRVEEKFKNTEFGNKLEKISVMLNADSDVGFLIYDYNTGEISEPDSPRYMVMGHELVHAYRRLKNIPNIIKKEGFYTYLMEDDGKIEISSQLEQIEELEAAGINYFNKIDKKYIWASGFKYTENALRIENGLGLRIKY